jgi:hypothetical protein
LRCTPDDPVSFQLEAPILIDPLTDQARLISYEKDEDGCIAVVAEGIEEQDRNRAKVSIEILGLNLRDKLNKKRNEFWDKCMLRITDYEQSNGPQALKLVRQTIAKTALKEMIA